MKARKRKDERREEMIGGRAESSDKLTSPVVGAFGRRSRASSARVRAPDSRVGKVLTAQRIFFFLFLACILSRIFVDSSCGEEQTWRAPSAWW